MKIIKRVVCRSGKPAKTEPMETGADATPVRYESEQKPEACLQCGAPTIANIQYGLPLWSDELKEKIANNEIVLGGCIVTSSNPSWKCTSCGVKMHSQTNLYSTTEEVDLE